MAKTWKPMTDAEFERQNVLASARAKRAMKTEIQARSASFDRKSKQLVIELKNGVTLMIPTHRIQGLRKAPPELIAKVELWPRGAALHWEELDADFSVAGLLKGVFGSRTWMAELGREGGRSTSPAKQAASRANGRKGGRPRKKLIAEVRALERVTGLKRAPEIHGRQVPVSKGYGFTNLLEPSDERQAHFEPKEELAVPRRGHPVQRKRR